MNLDYMSQFAGPGTGGFMAGVEQKQIEDKRYADTQKTLQEIVASQGQESERAALLPGKLAQESDRAAMAPLARQESQGRIDAASAKERAETMKDYIDAQIKFGDAPGGQETIAQDPRFTKMQGHPISKRAQEILILGRTDPDAAKKQWEEMKEKISTSAATIEKRQQEDATAKRAEGAQSARAALEDKRIAGQREMLILKGQMNREIQELKNEAAQAKTSAQKESVSQVVGAALRRMDEAELSGDPEQMKEARRFLDQAKGVAKEINAAVTTEKGQNAVLRARALGIEMPDYAPVAAQPTATTPPATVPAAPGQQQLPPGVRKVGPAPVKTSEAPSGPGPIAQALDAGAAAILPSAQAAQPNPTNVGGGGYDWGRQEAIMPNVGNMPPPQQGGMMQPVNAGPAPTVRAPANINFAATDIGPSGRAGVLQQEWKDLQSDITKAQNRLNVARRGGDREYIAQLEENLKALERSLPMLAREIQSMSRGK